MDLPAFGLLPFAFFLFLQKVEKSNACLFLCFFFSLSPFSSSS